MDGWIAGWGGRGLGSRDFFGNERLELGSGSRSGMSV